MPASYLEDAQIHNILRNPPRVRPCRVAHARGRYLFEIEPSIVFSGILDHLRPTDGGLTHASQEVPKAKLQRNLVRVRLPA